MLDRTVAPPFQKTNNFVLIKPERIVLSNGIQITYVDGGEQEVVKIEFIFKAGKWYENQPGVSYFTAHLLQKGTVQKTSYQISAAFDQLGIHLEFNPGYDFTSIALYGLNKNIDRVFDLTNEILTQPSFPDNELQQAKDIYIQGLKINLEKTSYLASLQLRKNLFGEDHPYGYDATVDQIRNIKRTDLSDFHQRLYADLEVICSGKITPQIKNSIEKALSGFLKSNIQEPAFLKVNRLPFYQIVEKEGSVQSSIRLGKLVVGRNHADYPALLLLNHIFGGYFGSRLMKNIREEKGLTYGIYSSIVALKHDTYVSIGADVNKENRELTVEEIKKEIQALRSELIGDTEFETARNHFIGGFQSEISTPFAHADKIKNMMFYHLPENYYQNLLQKIEQLNSANLRDIANRYLAEDTFFEVAAG